MPVLFRYKGFHFFIYSNEHDPPHVHVQKAGKHVKVQYYKQGNYNRQLLVKIRGKFSHAELSDIADFTREYRQDMIFKWKEFIINHKKPKNELIKKIRKKVSENGDK
jgi:Domain of unknown function (DUF4160)